MNWKALILICVLVAYMVKSTTTEDGSSFITPGPLAATSSTTETDTTTTQSSSNPTILPPPTVIIIPDPTSWKNTPPPTHKRKSSRLKKFEAYEGCQIIKSCVSPPKLCSSRGGESTECIGSKTCEMLVTFGDNPRPDENVDLDKEIIIEMFHPAVYKWMAIGFTEIDNMASAYVVECVLEEQSMQIYNSFNLEGVHENRRLRGDQSVKTWIRLLEADRDGTNSYCRFALKHQFFVIAPNGVTKEQIKYHFALLKTPYFLLYAWGVNIKAEREEGNLDKHATCDRRFSSKKIAFWARYAPNKVQRTYLRLHAVSTVAAILFFFTVGMFTGRYFKETFVTVKVLKMPLWLFVHTTSMTIGVVLLIIALGLEIQAHEGWTSQTSSNFHSYGGCVVFGVMAVVFGLGFFIKPTKYKEKNVASILHGFGGNFVYFLCLIILIAADQIVFSGTPCQLKWIVGTWTITVLILHCVLTYHYCWVDWVLGIKARGFGCFPIGIVYAAHEQPAKLNNRHGLVINLNPKVTDIPNEAPGRKIRVVVISFIIFLGFLYALWCCILVLRNVSGQKDCFLPKSISDLAKSEL